MRASTIALAIAIAWAGTRAAHAQNGTSGLFIAPQVSTLGLGVEAGYRVSDLFGLRGSANFFHVKTDFNVAGIEYTGKVQLRSFGATVVRPVVETAGCAVQAAKGRLAGRQ